MSTPQYLIAADTGGTFTDLVIYDRVNGETKFGKTLTSYDDLVAAVLSSLQELDVDLSEAVLLKHGTTQVINAFVQRQGGRVALVTTAGFRDILEIARGSRPVPFDLKFRRMPPLVPRDRWLAELGRRLSPLLGGAVGRARGRALPSRRAARP